ncbi:MAG: 3',5'-cyclic-nucleotide phosphodiesterase [Nitrospirota bacterium]|nr:3',5'-cyclic-nucleotide phosphodiesterase [Nitrospirota bacterium]
MNIRVLGSHGSDLLFNEADQDRACRCVGFLVDQTFLIDPGTVACKLTIEEQLQLQHVLLSHAHFDHIKSLPAIADNLVGLNTPPVVIASIAPVLQAIRAHIFNEDIFPDFFNLPTPNEPVLADQILYPEKELMLGHLGITPYEVNHTIPCSGYLVRDHQTSWVFSGDTYQTETLWNAAKQDPHLKAAFIETSFPDEMLTMAVTSKHLTPSLLSREFQKIGRPDLPLFIYHMKPRFRDRIAQQLTRLKIPNLHILEEDEEISI